ncbi:hypothetical protein N657DRAFT_680833 [Parathielavia appendiculata]|uniref:Proteophosphoglycan 5 n=1 Tax=Parathielavia appendiculata TaxID=2587402 RepID=A0AAN6TZN4_9PEZI|nr:hypothetical protein N657DRAFT_680833 [Parathielavia appendiculata]
MEQPPSLPAQKNTPARRRAKRPVNSPARKTYASENDMPSEAVFPIELGGPLTPQKPALNSLAPSSQPNQGRSKGRNGNRSRPKQVSSPGPAKQGRTTPPQTSAPKPISAPAFAGATFHASPAPSSLPIPSFLSKALDSPSVQETDHASREPSPPATDSEAPTPQHRILSADITRHESPLDIFFRADRAEKERARRASSANILGHPKPVPFSPPTQTRSPAEPTTLPAGLFGGPGNRRPPFHRNASSGIPASELDGTQDSVIGPALSKPYQERIREAQSSRKPSETGPRSAPSTQDASTLDMSERLKRFLAIPSVEADQPPPKPPAVSRPVPTNTLPAAFPTGGAHPEPQPATLPSPFSRRPDANVRRGPATQGPPPLPCGFSPGKQASPLPTAAAAAAAGSPEGSRSPEILHMEDSLRRMLKLNLGPTSSAVPPPTTYQSS